MGIVKDAKFSKKITKHVNALLKKRDPERFNKLVHDVIDTDYYLMGVTAINSDEVLRNSFIDVLRYFYDNSAFTKKSHVVFDFENFEEDTKDIVKILFLVPNSVNWRSYDKTVPYLLDLHEVRIFLRNTDAKRF